MSSASIDDLNEVIRRFTQLTQQKPLTVEASAELDELERRLLSDVADKDEENRERYGRDALLTLLEADREAFVRFVQRRADDWSRAAAEDVIQQVMEKILKAYPRHGLTLAYGRRSLQAYVKKAAARLIARQQRVNQDTPTDPDKVSADVELDDGRPATLDRVLGDIELQQWILQTIMAGLVRRVPRSLVRSRSMRLPSHDDPKRDVILVFGQLQGLTAKELATQLDMTVEQVNTYQGRARARFKEMFAALCVARSMRIADGNPDGTTGCPELTAMLVGWDSQRLQAFSTDHFHEVLKHSKKCLRCGPTFDAVLDMSGAEVAGIFRGVPLLASPEVLRRWLQDQDDDDRRSRLDVLLMRRSNRAITEHLSTPATSGAPAATPSSGHVAAVASGVTVAGEPSVFSRVKTTIFQPFSALAAKVQPWVSTNDPSSMVQVSHSGPAIVGATTAVVLGITAVLTGPHLRNEPQADVAVAATPAPSAPATRTSPPTNPPSSPLASTPATSSPARPATTNPSTPPLGTITPGSGSGTRPTTGTSTTRDAHPGGVNPPVRRPRRSPMPGATPATSRTASPPPINPTVDFTQGTWTATFAYHYGGREGEVEHYRMPFRERPPSECPAGRRCFTATWTRVGDGGTEGDITVTTATDGHTIRLTGTQPYGGSVQNYAATAPYAATGPLTFTGTMTLVLPNEVDHGDFTLNRS